VTNYLEVAVNAVNLVVSIAILAVLAILVNQVRALGVQVSMASLFFQVRESEWAARLVLYGLIVFLVSNMLELYGDVVSIDWTVNEIVETASLFLLLAGLYRLAAMLRIPASARTSVHVDLPEARP